MKNKIVECDTHIASKKHYFKKALSLLLSLVMLFSVTSAITITAEAATKIATLYWPVHDANGNALKTVSTHHSSSHHGIDIKASAGQKWYAAYNGTIDKVYRGCKTNGKGNHKNCDTNKKYFWKNTCNYGIGNGVVIKCSIGKNTYYMQYAHMNSVASGLKAGDKIKKGTYLGTVGDRGYSFGAHAHFEINKTTLFKNYQNNDPTSSGCIFSYDYSKVTTAHTLTVNYNINGGSISSGTYKSVNSLVYKTSTNAKFGQTWTYNKAQKDGLYNAKTFGLSRSGYTFVGWGTTSTGGKVFDQNDISVLPTDINSNVKTKNCSTTLYAIWKKNNTNTTSKTTSSQIVEYAKKFKGYPYVLNTHGPNSFDCSGFVYYVFKNFGITLSTASKDYYNNPTKYGTKITGDSNAQLGDIVVWSGHVGIYIGNGKVINALNASKGVCETKISEYINSSGTMNPSHFYIRVQGVSSSSNSTTTTTKPVIQNPSVTVNAVSNLTTNSVQLNFTANNPSKVTIKTVGVQVKKKGTSEWKTKQEAMNSSYTNSNSVPMWWTVGSGKELNMSLSAGTTYEYRAYVVYNGKNYYSSTSTFTTKSAVKNPSVTVNSVTNLAKTSVQLNFTANNPSKVTIKKIGVQVRKKGTSEWKTKSEAMNSKYTNATSVKMWWTVGSKKELNMSLSAGTTYEYRAYVVYNNKNYYSSIKTFTTKK